MDKLISELEIFCYVVERKPFILYLPTMWLFFCCGMALMMGNLSVEPNNVFYEIVQNKLQKQHFKLLIIGVFGFFILVWRLYRKWRKHYFG